MIYSHIPVLSYRTTILCLSRRKRGAETFIKKTRSEIFGKYFSTNIYFVINSQPKFVPQINEIYFKSWRLWIIYRNFNWYYFLTSSGHHIGSPALPGNMKYSKHSPEALFFPKLFRLAWNWTIYMKTFFKEKRGSWDFSYEK